MWSEPFSFLSLQRVVQERIARNRALALEKREIKSNHVLQKLNASDFFFYKTLRLRDIAQPKTHKI